MQLRAFSQEALKNLICNMNYKIALWKLLPYLLEMNELSMDKRMMNDFDGKRFLADLFVATIILMVRDKGIEHNNDSFSMN